MTTHFVKDLNSQPACGASLFDGAGTTQRPAVTCPTCRALAPMAAIQANADAIRKAEAALGDLVTEARDAGRSWAAIGDALGISKQAAQQKYGRKTKTPQVDPDQLTLT